MDDRVDALNSALEHLRSALDLLDEANAPEQIGAHVDLAAHQLEELVGTSAPREVGGQSGNC